MTQCLIDRRRLLIPPSIIYADQVKRCYHNYDGLGSATYTWSDVTNNASTSLYHEQSSTSSDYNDDYFLQFRIPKNRLSWFSISTVKVYFRCISTTGTIPIRVYVKDYDEYETGASSVVSGTITASGWIEAAITSLFTSDVSDPDGVWYVQVRIPGYPAISYDTTYEAYVNTLNGDYDPYIQITYN